MGKVLLPADADDSLGRKYPAVFVSYQRSLRLRHSHALPPDFSVVVLILLCGMCNRSGIAQGLSGPLYTVVAISSFITVYMSLREAGQLPDGWIPLSIDNPTAFSFMSFALSLLLVRTASVQLVIRQQAPNNSFLCRLCRMHCLHADTGWHCDGARMIAVS